MEENKWIEQLKERSDQSIFRDVHFTSTMMDGVRQKISKRSRFRSGWGWSLTASALLMFIVLWQVWPVSVVQENAAPSRPSTSLLPGGVPEAPVLWEPSPRMESTFDKHPFSYAGEKPVRIITDETGFYEGQQQRVFWLLDGDHAAKVDLVAYSSYGKRLALGSYQVIAPLFDAKGHFPSGIVLPEPGVWKLQVLSEGKHLGQVFVQVQSGISPANRELVEPLIRRYLETEGEKLGWLGADRKITLDLLGVEAPDAQRRKVYAWAKIMSKDPLLSSGISAPMTFDIAYDGNEYRVLGFQQPEDGSNYQSSLQRLFPQKVLDQIKARQ